MCIVTLEARNRGAERRTGFITRGLRGAWERGLGEWVDSDWRGLNMHQKIKEGFDAK